ncbi:uncharacterized protein Stk11ip_0 isoform X4 [Zeugodacus cucurbitae]|uniref:uncharacterized protein Stk11ip_0 isoform X4 n=1 Tax=Zeugodacus cucurbitae TaxID=28588 RepID=UPI0023D94D02|nr:uncharacterized protein Stk11ip_0 isoform X4 [Zeugodacus cucurbitae]
MDPQKITELANLLRKNGDKILSSEFSLTLSGSLLRALNDSFTLITDGAAEIGTSPQTFQVAKTVNSRSPVFTDLQLIYDFVQKTPLLCIVHYATDEYFDGTIDISKFRALRRLEVQKTSVRQVVGIQRLRAQLQQLICVKSLTSVEDIITRCGGDNSNGFVWNELKIADFSYNNLQRVDAALEFAQFLQHLNLRHNKLRSVEAVKWLPHLKTLDLSYNCLQCVPQFHLEAYKRLQSLNMSNNFVEDLMGIAKLEALTDLDLSDNCLLDHSCLLPLSALITLNYLNLYGNALCCHPKHRLATAQFLHKNTATVKFLLDLEPLSKSEKSVTGSQQLRHVGALNRYAQRSSSTSINSSRVPSSTHTPSSSVGSLSSFKFNVSSTNSVKAANGMRKSSSKTRTVDIIEDEGALPQTTDERDEAMLAEKLKPVKVALEKVDISEQDTQHLEAKKQIENLREKYGVNWLQSGNAEMIQSALEYSSFTGMETKSNTAATNTSRQQLDDFLGELSESALASSRPTSQTQYDNNATYDSTLRSSTPLYESRLSGEVSKLELHASPIKANGANDNNDATMYQSMNSTNSYTNENQTFYRTVNDSDNTLMQTAADSLSSALEQANMSDDAETEVEIDDEPPHLKNVYANATIEESDVSEPEDDEVTYIVYTMPRNEAVFLTISENYLRVRDTLTQKTITKWSLKILESCDRIKSNTIRINFDTIKADKKERIYTVEDGLCQELERKLRDILSQRDLTEMNQTVYRCVNCTCQFAVETKYKPQNQAIHCPDCKSSFVAEIHDIPKPTIEPATEKLSPAAIVEETPLYTNTPPKATTGVTASIDVAIDTNSIALVQTTNNLMSSSRKSNSQVDQKCEPYKFNYTDFNDIDHRLKLYFYQTKFDENEQFKWVARGRLYNDNTKTLCAGIVVMSTCKCYLMEAFASENEDVAKWLRLLVSVTADRLESIQLLPWKLGLAFTLRDWGNFELLLQDILRTDSLLLYFANNSLPSQCELKYQPTNELVKRINNAVTDEQLKMCALLNACTVTCGQAKRNLSTCTLLTTDTHLCVSSSKFDWISTTEADAELEICMKQLMSNLVEVELIDANSFLINYLDETQDQSETWQCTFETKENANSCLNAIAQSWEKLFGVSLLNT